VFWLGPCRCDEDTFGTMTEFPEAYVTPGLETLDEDVVGLVEDEVLDRIFDEETEVEVVAVELDATAELLAAAADDVIDAYPIRKAPR